MFESSSFSGLVFAVSTVLLASACSGAERPAHLTTNGDDNENGRVDSVSSPIIEGVKSDASQDAVVYVSAQESGREVEGCTGTMVAPNLVLTARHCVSRLSDGDAGCGANGASTTPSADGVRILGDYTVTDMLFFAGLATPRTAAELSEAGAAAHGKTLIVDANTTICDNDIAFVLLDRKLMSLPTATLRLDRPPTKGELLTAVGYGLDATGDAPPTRMQRRDLRVLTVGPEQVSKSEFVVGEAVCRGDSGGPVFAQTSGALLGVVSRGGNGADVNPNNVASSCVGKSVSNFYTHLATKHTLVDRAFKAAGFEPRTEDPTKAGSGGGPEQAGATPEAEGDGPGRTTTTNPKRSSSSSFGPTESGGCSASGPPSSLLSERNWLAILSTLSAIVLCRSRRRARAFF